MRLWTIFVALIFISLVGCEQAPDRPQENGADASQPAKSAGYLRIPFDGSISTIDPSLTVDIASIELVEHLFLGLTDFDPNTYEVLPELATSWAVSDDSLTYTFKLREDVKWTNGDSVTAHDIVWAVKRNLDPKLDSYYVFTLFSLKNAEAIYAGKEDISTLGVQALDDFTVEFQLARPTAYFPALVSIWTYRPLPSKAIEAHGDEWTLAKNIQTNGSYHLTSWKKGTSLTLEKNPNFYNAEQVNIKKIEYLIVPESSLGIAMYENNELDIIGQQYLRIPLSDIPRIKSNPYLSKELSVEPQFCTEFYGFNTQVAPTNNPLVRKAIAAAVNKQLLVDVVTKGNQTPATTFTRPPIFGAVDPEEKVGIQFDPIQAKKWLAEAGYPDAKGLPKIVLMHNSSEVHHANAVAIQTMLKHYINVDVEVQDQNFDDYLDTLDQPTTPNMFRFGWCADYPDANNWLYEVFHPTVSPNWIGWNNQEFAKVVEAAQSESDPKARLQLYRRAEEILNTEETAIVPLYFATALYLVKPWVNDWYIMAFGGQQIRNWSLAE
ncbi:peptide ABC transporter substrate-binding protein [Candidatus Albibeggiatoa sp. nov. NOAA]|uniref:peptide ABC transporter substrate-binding protein n=1 Tax=Candidatus Albibeggiatoa sp. nov. NOAA TaxID=3162724 RepID=UPI003302A15D|nr:peptide ABC transporter substrate-binding protein [Thiotrichaceae bacterium]